MKALQIDKPNSASIISIDEPQIGDNDVLIKVMASGICGTDIHIYKGEYVGNYPIVPGHELSGEIVKIGENITRFIVGDRVAIEPNLACNNCDYCLNNNQNFCKNWQAIGVTCQGGMAQFVKAPENAVFNMGPKLSWEEGAFVEPLSCVIHGLERAEAKFADRVLIIGAGPIGTLLAQTVQLQGTSDITIVETNAQRLQIADSLGLGRTTNSLNDIESDFYDLVIDATGVPKVMALTQTYVRYGGTILLFGVPPVGRLLELDAFQIFRKGLKILSSFTSVRNSFQALNLLSGKRIDVNPLISHRLPLEDFNDAMKILSEKGSAMKIMLIPN